MMNELAARIFQAITDYIDKRVDEKMAEYTAPGEATVPPTGVPEPPATGNSKNTSVSREATYILFAKAERTNNATEAFFQIIDKLAKRRSTLLEELAARGYRRRIAKQKSDLKGTYHATARSCSGRWISSHGNNKAKQEILKTACEISEIPWDNPIDGLEVRFPNTDEKGSA